MQDSEKTQQDSLGVGEHEEAEGARNELDYRKVFNTVKEMIIIQDAKTGQIIDVNEETVERTGYSREELIERGVACFSPDTEEYSPDRAMQHVTRAAQGEPQLFEWGYVDRSGVFHPTEVSLRSALISGVPCLLATAREITERKLAEEKIRIKSLALERSNAELERFAYVASHDLQEPLRMVLAFGDMLKQRCSEALDEDGLSYLGYMQGAAARMNSLLKDLMTFSRVTTRESAFEPVDLSVIAREVMADLDLRIAEVGGRVELGDLPAIEADALQMRQLLQNLLDNALKFRHPERPPEVKVSTREADGSLRLSVEDNGIGLDERFADRIFTIFQRLHARDEYDGTGVGLAICQKIVERHKGTLTVASTPGNGATFVATLPLAHRDVNADTSEDGGP